MTYSGKVRNGVVVLDDPAALPEGTPVQVQPIPESEKSTSLRLGLREFAGSIKDLPSDFARNHDHYIHGAPKQ